MVAAVSTAAATEPLLERRLGAMGTRLEVRIWGDHRPTALEASEAAVRAVLAAEDRLSTWRDDSELARLNATPPAEEIALSPQLAAELAAARELWRRTDGGFDPGIGALVDAWGLRSGGRRPSDDELAAARAASGVEHLELRGRWARRTRADLRVEEGGFGKGAALDDALAVLRGAGVERATIDLGGQVAVLGTAAVELAHPWRRDRILLRLGVTDASVATSGNGERSVEVDGERYGHLLDPATGRPVGDWGSLTVVAGSALEADALATGLYRLGAEGAVRWAARQPGVDAIAVEPAEKGGEEIRVLATGGVAGAIERIDPGVQLRVMD